MTPELEKKLFTRFKFFHPEKSPQQGLMCFGFSCGDGWFKVIWKLCEDIEKLLPKTHPDYKKYPFEVVQVKEKFGGLRFYTNWTSDDIHDRIDLAGLEASKTCEHCGKKGKLENKDGWYMTMCKTCFKKVTTS